MKLTCRRYTSLHYANFVAALYKCRSRCNNAFSSFNATKNLNHVSVSVAEIHGAAADDHWIPCSVGDQYRKA